MEANMRSTDFLERRPRGRHRAVRGNARAQRRLPSTRRIAPVNRLRERATFPTRRGCESRGDRSRVTRFGRRRIASRARGPFGRSCGPRRAQRLRSGSRGRLEMPPAGRHRICREPPNRRRPCGAIRLRPDSDTRTHRFLTIQDYEYRPYGIPFDRRIGA